MLNEMWTNGSTVAEIVGEDLQTEPTYFTHFHYVDLGPISRGAFGDVRRVRDTRDSRVLAMKIIRRSIASESRAYARFATEIELMTSLRHPGVLRVQDQGEFDDGRLWFTMPEVQGRTFSDLLDEISVMEYQLIFRSPLFRRALDSLAQFCQIMAFAHERSIVHRDLKPKNMMLTTEGERFVIDWGIAKQLTNDQSSVQRVCTEPGEVLGTPAYMPPEQALGDISLQYSASDVYSLGAVLYHLLTGEPPYRGTRSAVIAQIKRGPPQPISKIIKKNRVPPAALIALCEAAMQRQANKRISGAMRFAQDLRQCLQALESKES